MNPLDDSLRRLFQAAARAPKPAPPALPGPALAGVLRQWRSRPAEDDSASLLTLFRAAVIFASFIMVLSVTANYLAGRNDAAGPLPLAQYALTLQLPP
jgi:hypothetical protein